MCTAAHRYPAKIRGTGRDLSQAACRVCTIVSQPSWAYVTRGLRKCFKGQTRPGNWQMGQRQHGPLQPSARAGEDRAQHLARLLLLWVGRFESNSQIFAHTQLCVLGIFGNNKSMINLALHISNYEKFWHTCKVGVSPHLAVLSLLKWEPISPIVCPSNWWCRLDNDQLIVQIVQILSPCEEWNWDWARPANHC